MNGRAQAPGAPFFGGANAAKAGAAAFPTGRVVADPFLPVEDLSFARASQDKHDGKEHGTQQENRQA